MSSHNNAARQRDEEEGSSGLGRVATWVGVIGLGIGVGAAIYKLFGSEQPCSEQPCSEQPYKIDDSSYSYPATSAPHAQCSVCQEELAARQVVTTLPCMHTFHRDCISHWISGGHNTCPDCRRTVY